MYDFSFITSIFQDWTFSLKEKKMFFFPLFPFGVVSFPQEQAERRKRKLAVLLLVVVIVNRNLPPANVPAEKHRRDTGT